MSQTNLSCVLYGPGKARFENRPVPSLKDAHDVIIRITYVGVCGSDVHFWTDGGFARKVSEDQPLVMGHEASGIVRSIGPDVTLLKPGDRVAIEPGFSCRRCKQCKDGRYNLCPKMKFAADPPLTQGTLSRFFSIPEDFAYKIPDSLSLEEAVLVEPLAVAVHGIRLAGLEVGQRVLVQGSGTIGLLTAAVAKAYGAKQVYITDVNLDKIKFAKKYLECSAFIPDLGSTPEENAARFKTETGLDDGVDAVIECTGVEASTQTGLLALSAGGVLVQVGLGKPVQAIPIHAMSEKEIVLKTSFRYGPGDYEIALELLESGKVSVRPLISSITPFEKATEAWEKTRKGKGIKNLIRGVQD